MIFSLATPCCASLRVRCAASSPSSPLISTCRRRAAMGRVRKEGGHACIPGWGRHANWCLGVRCHHVASPPSPPSPALKSRQSWGQSGMPHPTAHISAPYHAAPSSCPPAAQPHHTTRHRTHRCIPGAAPKHPRQPVLPLEQRMLQQLLSAGCTPIAARPLPEVQRVYRHLRHSAAEMCR